MVVNDELERAADELERIVRGELGRRLSPPRRYTPSPMIKPRVDELLERTDSHYAAVVVAAKRARQLNSYYRALGEGSYEEYTPPMVETPDRQLPDDRPRGARRRARSSTATASSAARRPATARPRARPAGRSLSHGPDPARRERRHRRLQGARARAPGDRAGHGVRVLMTPTAERFVGAASFEGIVGAPVLIDEFERDPLRGAFPGDEPPAHDPIGHLELVANADAYLVAPASANTIAKLAAGICDSMLTTSFLACTAPRAGRAGDERPHVRRRGDPGEPGDPARARRAGDRARRAARSPRAGSTAPGGCPTPSGCSPSVEALLPRRAGPWDGLRVLVTAGGTREPIDSVRFIGNRSSGRMGLALADARGPPRRRRDPDRRQRRAVRPPAGDRDGSTSRRPPSSRAAVRERVRGCPRAADGRRRRPTSGRPPPERAKISRERRAAGSSCAWSRPRTSSPGVAARPAPGPDPGRLRRRARRATRSSGRARSSSARASTRSSSTTSRAPRSASTRSATR